MSDMVSIQRALPDAEHVASNTPDGFALGMTAQEHAELLAMVGITAETNRLVDRASERDGVLS